MASLKLKPYLDDANKASYEISGLNSNKEYRISLENATHGINVVKPKEFAGVESITGNMDLSIPEHSKTSVVSVFANIEEKTNTGWKLSEISSFSHFFSRSKSKTPYNVSIFPSFVGPSDTALIKIDSAAPNSSINVDINSKIFKIRTNSKGEGSMSFRGVDIISGSISNSQVIQQFPITTSSSNDSFSKQTVSNSVINFIPDKIRGLQATNDPGHPTCAIIDPDPGPGLSLQTKDNFCFSGSVVGPYSIFTSDKYINSNVGFCSNVTQITPSDNDCCRLYNSTSSVILPNGAGLVAYSSQTTQQATQCEEITLASRIYITHIPTSLKYSGNPVREVTILKPAKFYHSTELTSVSSGDVLTISFRFKEDGETFSIEHIASSSSESFELSQLAISINSDQRIIDHKVTALARGNRLDIYSDNRFSITVTSTGNASLSLCINYNRSIEVLVPPTMLDDNGNTLLFLNSPLGSQSYTIESKISPDIIRIAIEEGVNNGIGPTIEENITCQKAVILNTNIEQGDFSNLDTSGIVDISPLPFIKDVEGREVPSVYPSISARKERINGQTYVYVVCQAPVDGIYQLFYYSFELGETNFDPKEWKQLTSDGENKNAKIACDSVGNLYIVWESDRSGTSQVYYGVLGLGSNILLNQTLASIASREQILSSSPSLFSFSDPSPMATLPSWIELYTNDGIVAVNSTSSIDITTNPSIDGALAIYRLSTDENDVTFDGKWSQLSYQISFDLSLVGLPTTVTDDIEIEKQYKTWKEQFEGYENYKYYYANNIMSLNNCGTTFDTIIPIVGSYKISSFPDVHPAQQDTQVNIDSNGNLKHFMLAIMPEKYIFKAVNTEPLFVYCSRNNVDVSGDNGYLSKIESVNYTGRFKLALILSTSENESSSSESDKSFQVIKMLGDYFDFASTKNFKIAMHYSKGNSDLVDWKTKHDPYSYSQDYRYYGDILISIDNTIVAGESFVADFSDQFREFDIGLGVPSGGNFATSETLPYNGNIYDNANITLSYNNIVVGKHSIQPNSSVMNFNTFDRNTSTMVVNNFDSNDELDSATAYDALGLTFDNFNLNYNIELNNGFSQIPITLSTEEQNRNPSLIIDCFDKPHVVWQSNRNNEWDIYYGGAHDRSIPFRYETRITSTKGNSIMPTIGVDDKGRRIVVWQDNRDGLYQIYAAISNDIDSFWIDKCTQEEAKAYLYKEDTLAREYDPYFTLPEEISCKVAFDFDVPFDGNYHFMLYFYSDPQKTTLYRKVSSKDSLVRWRVNGSQILSTGSSLSQGETVTITYNVSKEDGLSNIILYLSAMYEGEDAQPTIDQLNSTNITVLDPEPSLNFNSGYTESNTLAFTVVEYHGRSPININAQNEGYFSESSTPTYTGMTFEGSLTELPGVLIGDDISVVYVHWDPSGNAPPDYSISGIVIKLSDPVAAILFKRSDLNNTDQYFGIAGASYPTDGAFDRGLEFNPNEDSITISEDRLTLTINKLVVSNYGVDSFRIVTKHKSNQAKASDFVFYCPFEQSPKCNSDVSFTNNYESSKTVHFRVSYFSDPDKKSAILTSFTMNNVNNWLSGTASFPSSGLIVNPGQSVIVSFNPEILPFEQYNQQNTVSGNDKQSLLCGVTYYVKVESFYDQSFHTEYESTFICPCDYAKVAKRDSDNETWISTAHGRQDFRITDTHLPAIKPNCVFGNNGVFYITWEDYRYSEINTSLSKYSADYFMALWVPEEDKFYCSGQGDYDRRIISHSTDGVLQDANVIIDQFQNITSVFHNGKNLFAKTCSLGCVLESYNPQILTSCMFTDSTRGNDADFFVIGESPERDTLSYMLMRIDSKYVKYSTYADLERAIPIIDDCYVELDIVGVPGTYAYRLRNEDDDNWTEWLPIGDDLPDQPSDTTDIKSEREFFKSYFIAKDRFIAPWICSPNNGKKRICCEILTFFGKTEQFCVDFVAMYKDLEYMVDLYFEDGTPVPKYKSYPVVSTKKTTIPITDDDLRSISEQNEPTTVSTIKAVITIKDKEKMALIQKMKQIDRFSYLGDMTMSVYQQGLNDQLNIPLIAGESEGTFTANFEISEHDGIVNVDGLSFIVVNIPGQCKPISYDNLTDKINSKSNSLEQTYSIENNLTTFKENYISGDIRKSFGSSDYYKKRAFGINLFEQN